MNIQLLHEHFTLLPQKALWWNERKIVLVADTHFGKVNHFRKSGIPVPLKANTKNWETLFDVIHLTKPERLICVGDLFHSHYNSDWESLKQFVNNFPGISFELITGNHDILSDYQYVRNKIVVHQDALRIGSFLLSHFPLEPTIDDVYVISGHIHPGVQLVGKGKQSIILPCFYFGDRQGYLPAFGEFTGLAKIKPTRNDKIFAIADNSILEINQPDAIIES